MSAPKTMPGVDEDVAKLLQAGLDGLNQDQKPDFDVPYFLSSPRHECSKARQSAKLSGKGVSTAIDTKEKYVTGWKGTEPLFDESADAAIIYREGTCKKCHFLARSEIGWVVLTSERPRLEGRVARA